METLKYLPAVSDRMRGGVGAIGYDRIIMIRDEFAALTQMASRLLSTPTENLTRQQVAAFDTLCTTSVAAVAALSPEDLDVLVASLPQMAKEAVAQTASAEQQAALRGYMLATVLAILGRK